MFTPEDVENLKLIYHLVKERGMTLAGAAQYLKNGITDTMRRDMELLDRLQRIRAELVEVREQLKDVPEGYTVVEVAQVEPEEEVTIEVAPAEPDAPAVTEEQIEVASEPTEEIDDDDDVEVEELVEIIYSDEEFEEEVTEEPQPTEEPAEEPAEESAKEEEPKVDTPDEEPSDNTPRPRGAKVGRRSKKQEAKLFEVKPEKQRPIAPFFDQTLF